MGDDDAVAAARTAVREEASGYLYECDGLNDVGLEAALDVLVAAVKVEALRDGDNLMHLIVYRGISEKEAAHGLVHEHITATEAELAAARTRLEAAR